MAMFIIGWLLTGAIFSLGFVVIKRGKDLTYGDLGFGLTMSLCGPITAVAVCVAVCSLLISDFPKDFWETPVFKKDK